MCKNHKDEQWVFIKDVKSETVSPGLERKVLAYCDTAMCVLHELDEGAGVPIHSHPHTQIAYVIKGRFRFTIEGVEKEVGKGDSLCKQGGVKHGVVCLEKGALVEFFTPMREDFVKAH